MRAHHHIRTNGQDSLTPKQGNQHTTFHTPNSCVQAHRGCMWMWKYASEIVVRNLWLGSCLELGFKKLGSLTCYCIRFYNRFFCLSSFQNLIGDLLTRKRRFHQFRRMKNNDNATEICTYTYIWNRKAISSFNSYHEDDLSGASCAPNKFTRSLRSIDQTLPFMNVEIKERIQPTSFWRRLLLQRSISSDLTIYIAMYNVDSLRA